MASSYYCPVVGPAPSKKHKPCPLYGLGQEHPCTHPSGHNAPGGLLIVGEAPGAEEDRGGKPFVGKSGQLLRRLLAQASVNMDEVTITNSVWCRPPENVKPANHVVKLCTSNWLFPYIDLLKPRAILSLGGTALKALLSCGEMSVMANSESVMTVPAHPEWPPLVVGIHPAAVLRSGGTSEPMLVNAIKKFKELSEGRTKVLVGERATVTVWCPKGVDDLTGLFRRIHEHRSAGRVAYDLETTGLDPFPHKDVPTPRVLCLSLASTDTSATVIPMSHKEFAGWTDGVRAAIYDELRALLNDPGVVKYGHNAKFDDLWLHQVLGIDVKQQRGAGGYVNQRDSMLLHALLDPDARHGLEPLVRRHAFQRYGEYWLEVDKIAHKSNSDVNYERVPLPMLAEYSGRDVMVTLHMHDKFMPELEDRGQTGLYLNHVMRASYALRRVEEAGLHLDKAVVEERYNEARDRLKKLTEDFCCNPLILPHLGPDFSLSKSDKVADLLYNKLGLPVLGKARTKRPSVDKDAIAALLESDVVRDEHKALLETLVGIGKVGKLLSTYLGPAMGDLVGDDGKIRHGWTSLDGMVHGSYKLHGTVTGRLSSERPNCQNLERRLIGIFDTPYPTGWFLSCDMAQIEARVMACYSGDEQFIRAFSDPTKDFHCVNAHLMDSSFNCGVFPHKSLPTCKDCEYRQTAKSIISFGLMYGMVARSLAKKLGVPEHVAQGIIDTYFNAIPGVGRWLKENVEVVKERGYTLTMLGRRRYIPDVNSSDRYVAGEAAREACNTPIQGSASDITLAALIRIVDRLEAGGYKARPVVTVHDQIGAVSPDEELNDVARLVKGEMDRMDDYVSWARVPFKADIAIGRHWVKG